MFKQNKKILMGLLALAVCATQAQAGFLNFDGELTLRYSDITAGKNKPDAAISSELKLSGSKRLPDGYKVNYGLRTGALQKSGYMLTGGESMSAMFLNELNLEFSPNSATTITLGRQGTPITTYSEVMFDKDLYLDGLAASYQTMLTPQAGIKINAAYILEKSAIKTGAANSSDYQETLFALQPEVNVKISEMASVSGYVAMIKTAHEDTQDSKFNNTVFGLNADLAVPTVKNVNFYAEMNDNSSKNVNKGKSNVFGLKVGDKTVAGLGSWSAGIESRTVEASSLATTYGDNTAGSTNLLNSNGYKGIKFMAETGIAKKVNARFTYQTYEDESGSVKDTDNKSMFIDIVARF